MSRASLLKKLSFVAVAVVLSGGFAPRVASVAFAQEGGDEGDDGAPQLSEEQRKELRSILQTQRKADETIQGEDYDAGAKVYKKLVEKLEKSSLPEKLLGDMKQNAHYNYACCLSRTGVKDEAVKEFARSVELGFFDWKHIAEDKDLDAIRDGDDFKKAVENGKKLEIDRLVAQAKLGSSPFSFSFDVKDQDGKARTPESYKGKTLLVVFFNAARDESFDGAAVYQKAAESLKDAGLEVLGLVFDGENDGVKELAQKHKISFPLATTDLAKVKEALEKGGGALVFDGSGKVRVAAPGIYQVEAIDAIAKALAGSGVTDKKDEKNDDKKDEKKDKKDDF